MVEEMIVGRRNGSSDKKWYSILKISNRARRAKFGIFHCSCVKYSIEIAFSIRVALSLGMLILRTRKVLKYTVEISYQIPKPQTYL